MIPENRRQEAARVKGRNDEDRGGVQWIVLAVGLSALVVFLLM